MKDCYLVWRTNIWYQQGPSNEQNDETGRFLSLLKRTPGTVASRRGTFILKKHTFSHTPAPSPLGWRVGAVGGREEAAAAVEAHDLGGPTAALSGEVRIRVEATPAAPEEVAASLPPSAEARPSAAAGSSSPPLGPEVWPQHPRGPASGRCSNSENTT